MNEELHTLYDNHYYAKFKPVRAGNYYETIHTFICPWPSTFGETYILVNLNIILFFAAMHGVFCADSYLQLYNSSSQKLFYRTMHASLELTSF